MITSMRDNSMKGINMANKCKLVLLLMLLGCGEMVWGGASYTVRVKAAKSPENAGYIYIHFEYETNYRYIGSFV